MAYSIQIKNLERVPESGLVYRVFYRVVLDENNVVCGSSGEIELTGNASDSSFIPFEDLDETIVAGWVENNLGSSGIQKILENIRGHSQKVLSNNTTQGLPWSNSDDD